VKGAYRTADEFRFRKRGKKERGKERERERGGRGGGGSNRSYSRAMNNPGANEEKSRAEEEMANATLAKITR